MPVITTPELDALVPVAEMPAPLAAQRALAGARAELAAVERQLATEPTDELGRAQRRLDAVRLEPERLRLVAAVAAADAALVAALDGARDELRARLVQRKREILRRVVPALRAAQRAMLELQTAEQREHELLGFVDRFAWSSLGANDTGHSFVDEWCDRLRAQDLWGEVAPAAKSRG